MERRENQKQLAKEKSVGHVEPDEQERERTFELMEKMAELPICKCCGGADFVYSKEFPGYRYCRHCDILMQPLNFEELSGLFSAMSRLRVVTEIWIPAFGVKAVIKCPEGKQEDISEKLGKIVNQYDAFIGKNEDLKLAPKRIKRLSDGIKNDIGSLEIEREQSPDSFVFGDVVSVKVR